MQKDGHQFLIVGSLKGLQQSQKRLQRDTELLQPGHEHAEKIIDTV
jgi:hypothetical protein